MVRKKLIEVDLPLDAINAESAKDASLTHGHPSTLQKWWARRPLATCRAVIFASMVDDPSACPDEFPTEDSQRKERRRLHDIICKMIKWKNTDQSRHEGKSAQNQARYEIARSVARTRGEAPPPQDDPAKVLCYLRDRAPPVHDLFAGGGSIPLEAQRLGLRAIASDLNPVSVLINKALIEIPTMFAGKPPKNPAANPMEISTNKFMKKDKDEKQEQVSWPGTAGLASDIRYYGNWMRREALKRIGRFYPTLKLSDGSEATVIVWMWARTVPCPNPACGITMPLIGSFTLSKVDSEYYLRPIIDLRKKRVLFDIQDHREGVPLRSTVNRSGATCIACNHAVKLDYVREQSKEGRLGKQMTAIIAKNGKRRLYLPVNKTHVQMEQSVKVDWCPNTPLPNRATKAISLQSYGMKYWHEVFTNRQLLTLVTFTKLIGEARNALIQDGAGEDYANAVCTYLAFAVSRVADSNNTFSVWESGGNKVAAAFSRQGLGMVWDFPEANPFSTSTQNWLSQVEWVAKVVKRLPSDVNTGKVYQDNATTTQIHNKPVIVTDPPYYDSIYYSDTSDFFYAWLRPMLREFYPDLFGGILTPKDEEMIANKYRFEESNKRFEYLMSNALKLIRKHCSPEFPSSIFYAYKQQEKLHGTTSTGWEAMLAALVQAGFQIIGTWPMRTENTRALKSNRNQLATSIVLVCRERPVDAVATTRREFVNELKSEMPQALRHMQEGNIVPVDLAQAAIGPGMSIFTRYSTVLDISGNSITVKDALTLINQTLDEVLAEQEGDFDADTRWALSWFKQSGFDRGDYGVAETLSKAKNTSVSGMVEAGILEAGVGKVRLLRPHELPEDWDPKKDKRFTVWEATHHLVRALDQGESAAVSIMASLGSATEAARELAYRLYRMCEQKNRTQEAQDYNALVQSWPEISRLARERVSRQAPQPAGLKTHDDR